MICGQNAEDVEAEQSGTMLDIEGEIKGGALQNYKAVDSFYYNYIMSRQGPVFLSQLRYFSLAFLANVRES